MADLLNEYRRERKRARDRLYRARKEYGGEFYAEDLPPIPENPTQADIDLLEELSKGYFEAQKTDFELEDEDQYAEDDEVADMSLMETLDILVTEVLDKVQSTVFLEKTGGYASAGRGRKSHMVPVDTDADKASIITKWRNYFDEQSQTIEGMENLYNRINNNFGYISELLNAIQFEDSTLESYRRHIGMLLRFFDELGTPTEFRTDLSRLDIIPYLAFPGDEF